MATIKMLIQMFNGMTPDLRSMTNFNYLQERYVV